MLSQIEQAVQAIDYKAEELEANAPHCDNSDKLLDDIRMLQDLANVLLIGAQKLEKQNAK